MSRARTTVIGAMVLALGVGGLAPTSSARESSLHGSGQHRQSVSDDGQLVIAKYGADYFQQKLIVENADGTNRRVIRRDDIGEIDTVRFSPDGRRFAVANQFGIFVRGVDDPGMGEPITLPEDLTQPVVPVWSPDGTQLALTASRWDGPDDQRSIVIVDARTLEGTVVAADLPIGWGVAWSPDGEWLAVDTRSQVSGCAGIDGETYFFTDIAKIRSDGTGGIQVMTASMPWDWRFVDWGPRGILGWTYETGSDGDVAEPCDGTRQTQLFKPDNGVARALRNPSPEADPISFSPDGNAYLALEQRGQYRLWRVGMHGKQHKVRVTRRALGADWGVLPTQ